MVARWSPLALLVAAPLAARAEWPVLRQGLWEIERRNAEIPSHSQTRRECTTPYVEVPAWNEDLRRKGCTVDEPVRSGSRYEYRSSCPPMRGSSTAVSIRYVIQVTGSDRYVERQETEAVPASGKRHRQVSETLARRVGECPTPAPAPRAGAASGNVEEPSPGGY